MAHITLKSLLLESSKEKLAEEFLSSLVKGTEWEDHVYIAGGYVRDQILGKDAKDIDLVVALPDGGIKFAEWVTKKMGNYKSGSNPIVFATFGTAKFNLRGVHYKGMDLGDIDIEAVMTRGEKYTPGSRKPDVAYADLHADVERRDATINSLLKKLSTGEIIDLTGKGLADIKAGIVRTPINPDKTFSDDPLRILRLVRMSAKYDWKIPLDILKSIKKNASQLTNISKERIHDEVNKMLLTAYPLKAFRLLQILGLMRYVFPSLSTVELGYMKKMSALKPVLPLRLIAALANVPPDKVRAEMNNLRYSSDTIKAVVNTIHKLPEFMKVANTSSLSNEYIRSLAYTAADIVPYLFAYASVYSDDFNVYEEEHKYSEISDELKENPIPVSGDDLVAMGMKPSQEFKRILDQFKAMYIKNPKTPKSEYLKLVKPITTESKLSGFSEITFSSDDDELMVHYSNSSGDPIRAYIYNDSPLLNFDYDQYDMPRRAKNYRWKWKKSSNPLFYYLDAPEESVKDFVWWIKQLGYVS